MSREVDIEKGLVALLWELETQGAAVDEVDLIEVFYDSLYPPRRGKTKRNPYATRRINQVVKERNKI